jgi:hypothetical protein
MDNLRTEKVADSIVLTIEVGVIVAAREHLPQLTPEEYFAWKEQQKSSDQLHHWRCCRAGEY